MFYCTIWLIHWNFDYLAYCRWRKFNFERSIGWEAGISILLLALSRYLQLTQKGDTPAGKALSFMGISIFWYSFVILNWFLKIYFWKNFEDHWKNIIFCLIKRKNSKNFSKKLQSILFFLFFSITLLANFFMKLLIIRPEKGTSWRYVRTPSGGRIPKGFLFYINSNSNLLIYSHSKGNKSTFWPVKPCLKYE